MEQQRIARPDQAGAASQPAPVQAFAVDAAERLQLALDAGAIIGTWVWDVANDCVTADERFSRSFGLPAERCLAGIPIAEAFVSIHGDDRERVSQAIDQALARGGPFRCEYRVRQEDGYYRWVEASGRVELNAQGRAVRFPGILMDIESRRDAQAERDRMSALLRTFTEAVPGVVYAKDRDGRMLVANHGATQLIGKPPQFYIGKTDLEFLEDKAQARQIMETDQRIMAGGKTVQVEEQVDMPDGSAACWLSVKAPLFNDAGEVIGLIGSSIDVTARKQAEAELRELNQTLETRISEAIAEREHAEAALRQAQKMEAVGQLTGGIAHDFNNLLAGIAGSLDLMRLRLKQGRTEDLERYRAVAHGATQRAASLTHRLLAFARRQTLIPEPTDVNALIDGMEELIRRTVGPSVAINVERGTSHSTCLVDPTQLENALLNLCINARDALVGGGHITISTVEHSFAEQPPADGELAAGRYLTVCVADDGVGMDSATLGKVFEPFFTTKPVGAGTGLGLSMVYGFAKQSGGRVRIASQPGQGTRVYLDLPSHSQPCTPAAQTLASSETAKPAPGTTVLVVDDEASVRLFVSEALHELGYVVIEAADSLAGLQLLRSDTRIDLLITDIGLPGGVDGRKMAHAGCSARPSLPVLFMTGYAEPQPADACILPGPTAVLTKPFSLEGLLGGIKKLTPSTD